jgi:hypothetical protein
MEEDLASHHGCKFLVSHINKLGLFPYFHLVSSLCMNDCGLVMIDFI